MELLSKKLLMGRNNKRFVAADIFSQAVYASEDGINWRELSNLPVLASWIGSAAGKGKYLLMNFSNFMVSSDGLKWKVVENPIPQVDNNFLKLSFAKDRFFLTWRTNDGTGWGKNAYYYHSKDGVNWTEGSFPVTVEGAASEISYVNGFFYSLVFDYPSGSSRRIYVFKSSDGVNWSYKVVQNGLGSTFYCTPVLYANNLYFVTDGRIVLTSSDGENWSSQSISGGINLSYADGVVFKDRFYIYNPATGSTVPYYSTDGITWNTTNYSGSTTTYRPLKLVTDGNILVSGGRNLLSYSIDGVNFYESKEVSGSIETICYGG